MRAFVSLIKSIFGICETPPLNPNLWDLENEKIKVNLELMTEFRNRESAVYLQGKNLPNPVLLIHDSKGNYLAYENKCTHMGRKLDPVEGLPVLRCCSVNHSTFNMEGTKLSGPAKGPINKYPVEIKDGNLWILI